MSESHSDVNTQHSIRNVNQPINANVKYLSSEACEETNESNMTCFTAVNTTLVDDSLGSHANSVYANLNDYPRTMNTKMSSGANYEDYESKPTDEITAPYNYHTSQNFNHHDVQYNIQGCCHNIQTESIVTANRSSEVSSNTLSYFEKEFVNGVLQQHENQNLQEETKIVLIGNMSNTDEENHTTPLHVTRTFHSIDEGKRRSPFEDDGNILVNIGDELCIDKIHRKNETNFLSDASVSDCSEVRFDNNQAAIDMLRLQHQEQFLEEPWDKICENERRSSLDTEYSPQVDMIYTNMDVTANIEVCDGASCFSHSTACSININNNIVENISNIAIVGKYLESFYSPHPPSDGIDTSSEHLVVQNSSGRTNLKRKSRQMTLTPTTDHEFRSCEPQHEICNKDLTNLLNLPDMKSIHYECSNGSVINDIVGNVNSSQIDNSLLNEYNAGTALIGLATYQTQCHPTSRKNRMEFSNPTTEESNVAERNQKYPDKQESEIFPNRDRTSHIFEWNHQTACRATTTLSELGSSVSMSRKMDAISGISYESSPGHTFANNVTPKIANRRNGKPDVSSNAKQAHHEQWLVSYVSEYSRKDESSMNEVTKSDWQSNKELHTPSPLGKNRGSVLSDDSELSAIKKNKSLSKKAGVKRSLVSATMAEKVPYPLKNIYSFSPEDAKIASSQHISHSENGQKSTSHTKPSNSNVPCAVVANSFWDCILSESELVQPCHVGLVSDVVIFAMAQMKLCGLTVDDRIGKYKNRELGFPGLCCIHCGGQPGFGRYFPGSFDSFLNGTNCDSMVQHIKNECRICPDDIRSTILKIYRNEPTIQNRPAHGSRRQFFELIWSKLTTYKVPNDNDSTSGESKPKKTKSSPRTLALLQKKSSGREQNNTDTMDVSERPVELFTAEHWNLLIGDSELVAAKDRHLVEDTLLIAFSQMMRCHLEEADRVGRKTKAQEEGFMGMCCKHCTGQSGNKIRYGRYFPSSLRSLSQVDTCQKIVRHVATGCLFCPAYVKLAAQKAIEFEKSHKRKYGSRILFYRRVWRRLHKQDLNDPETPTSIHAQVSEQRPSVKSQSIDNIAIWHRIIGDNSLVSVSDRDLVSSSELAAIAQMVPCSLTAEEQVGWFKDRPVGWGGLACKHCGGRPSYGKYFPKSSRAFAQTTCGQTILSHVTIFCKLVPNDIRLEIKNFQKIEASDKGMTSTGSRDHGSRKAFYSRIWKIIQNQGSKLTETTAFTGSKSRVHAKVLATSHQKQFTNTDNAHVIVDPRSLVGNIKSNWSKDQVLECQDRGLSVNNPIVNKKIPKTSTIIAHADMYHSTQWIPSVQYPTGHYYDGTFGSASKINTKVKVTSSKPPSHPVPSATSGRVVAYNFDFSQHGSTVNHCKSKPAQTKVYQLPIHSDTRTHNMPIGDSGNFSHSSNNGQVGQSQASLQVVNSTTMSKTANAKSRKKIQKPDLVSDRQNQVENPNFKSFVQTKDVGKAMNNYRNQQIIQYIPVTVPPPNSSTNYQSIHKEPTMQHSKSKRRKLKNG